MDDYDEAAFERVLSLNVKGVFHLTKFLRPLLDAKGTPQSPSRVINIGSIDGIHVPAMDTFAYSASKAAVHQLTRHLAKTFAPTITVNAIAPGPFQSRMMRATLEAFGDDIARAAPMKRIGQPSDMASATIFFASPAASYITGAILPVGGGLADVGFNPWAACISVTLDGEVLGSAHDVERDHVAWSKCRRSHCRRPCALLYSSS